MPKLRSLCALGAALAAVLALAAPGTARAGDDEITTTISLKAFKKAYGLYSMRQLVDLDPDDGITFRVNKVDADGNRIVWKDPNRQPVNVGKSTITFTVDKSAADSAEFDFLGRQSRGAPLVPNSCGLDNSGSGGVTSVTCGSGPSVSPS